MRFGVHVKFIQLHMTFPSIWQEKSQFLPRAIRAKLPIEHIPAVLAIENSY